MDKSINDVNPTPLTPAPESTEIKPTEPSQPIETPVVVESVEPPTSAPTPPAPQDAPAPSEPPAPPATPEEAPQNTPVKKHGCLAAMIIFIWKKLICRLFKICMWLLAILLVCTILLAIFIDPVIKWLINNSADMIDMDARVESVDVHYLTQAIILRNIKIMNPPGFIEKEACTIAKVEVRCNLFNRKHPIRRIYLQNPKIRLEGKFGKRILPTSVRRSNIFTIVREIATLAGVDLEKMMMAPPSPEPTDKPTTLTALEEEAAIFEKLGRVRVDNLHFENGMKDAIDVGSIILQKDSFEFCNVATDVCGVKTKLKNAIFDMTTQKIACTRLQVLNPEGYPEANALLAGRMSIQLGDDPQTQAPCIQKIVVQSPIVRFENKAGSMLGAFGLENNFKEIASALSIFSEADASNVYSEDFEIEIHDKDIAMPTLNLDGVDILDTTITCSYNDGFKIDRIGLEKGGVAIEGLRMNLAKLRARVGRIFEDYETQECTISTMAIRNPVGFPEENAFLLNELRLSTAMHETNIRGNRVLDIDHLVLNDFFVRLDSRSGDLLDLLGTDNNLFGLLADVSDASSFIPSFSHETQKEINESKTERPRRYIIRRLVLSGGEIRLGPRGDAIKLPMETMVLEDLGVEEGGLMMNELVSVLIREIALRAMEAAEEQLPPGWFLLQPIIKAFKALSRVIL